MFTTDQIVSFIDVWLIMENLTIKHFYEIYKTRLKMQEAGITNPPENIKEFTQSIVETLPKLPIQEIIDYVDGALVDLKGNVIIKFPEIKE